MWWLYDRSSLHCSQFRARSMWHQKEGWLSWWVWESNNRHISAILLFARELYEIAISLDKELKHYGGVHQIWWVASQNKTLQALLDNYDVTLIHLQDIVSTGKDENSNKASGYMNEMKTAEIIKADSDGLLSSVEFFLEERFIKHLVGEPHSLFSVFDFHMWPNRDQSRRL